MVFLLSVNFAVFYGDVVHIVFKWFICPSVCVQPIEDTDFHAMIMLIKSVENRHVTDRIFTSWGDSTAFQSRGVIARIVSLSLVAVNPADGHHRGRAGAASRIHPVTGVQTLRYSVRQ